MGRRRRTLLNAPTGRTQTAAPARQRSDAPSPAADLSYAEPLSVQEDITLGEDDEPTEIAPSPFLKTPDTGNPAPRPDGEFEEKAPAVDDLTHNRPALPDERIVPGLVMVGVVALLVILITAGALLMR